MAIEAEDLEGPMESPMAKTGSMRSTGSMRANSKNTLTVRTSSMNSDSMRSPRSPLTTRLVEAKFLEAPEVQMDNFIYGTGEKQSVGIHIFPLFDPRNHAPTLEPSPFNKPK